jgi:hypothetical protein
MFFGIIRSDLKLLPLTEIVCLLLNFVFVSNVSIFAPQYSEITL